MKATTVKSAAAVGLAVAAGLAVIATTSAKAPPPQAVAAAWCANASFAKVATGNPNLVYGCRQEFTQFCKEGFSPVAAKPPVLSKVGPKWRVEYGCEKSAEPPR